MNPRNLRQTHTCAELELSEAAYDEIESTLRAAGYGHAITEEGIDLTGLMATRAHEPETLEAHQHPGVTAGSETRAPDDETKPPCDCIRKINKFWVTDCGCNNSGDIRTAEAWCADQNRETNKGIEARTPDQLPRNVLTDCECLSCLRWRGVKDKVTGFPVELTRMIVCPVCGNKRCPRAASHDNACTGSNETPVTDDRWHPISTAPQSGTLIELRGRYPKTDEVIEILGRYDDSIYTHGWVDERGNTFYANYWRQRSQGGLVIADPAKLLA
jgi:hypothetical protein